MNTDLPKREEYYRPTRARGLERTHARLSKWAKGLELLGSISAKNYQVTLTASVMLPLLLVEVAPKLIPVFAAVGVAISTLGPELLFILASVLGKRSQKLDDEIKKLKQEHRARYVELQTGDEDERKLA